MPRDNTVTADYHRVTGVQALLSRTYDAARE